MKVLIDRALLDRVLDALEVYWVKAERHRTESDDAKADQAITDLREALQAKPQHITDGTPCWCNPELDYVDPITGAEVWVHKEPQ